MKKSRVSIYRLRKTGDSSKEVRELNTPSPRGNLHACYVVADRHPWEVGTHIVVQAYTIFLSSYSSVIAIYNYRYPKNAPQFSEKKGLGCPRGYLGWAHA